ncbi:MAG: hypothetical protein MJZ74_01565 [Muribaculaceae bacterium]|nr:hypothetical protein [Muribaculaceae bacterium]
MRRFISIIMVFAALAVNAQTPQQVLDKAISALKSAGTMSANYSVKTSQGTMSGSIILSGSKFRMLSKDVKTWYDGKTQWTYSTATHEVNVSTPTAEELTMTNPMAAANAFKTKFNMWKAAGQVPGHYVIMLQPKGKSEIKKCYLYISNGTNLLHYAHFKMGDGSTCTITLTNYKTKISVPASTFKYEAKEVPAGTQVVDLR